LAPLVLAGVLFTACDVLAPGDGGRVTVRFATTSASSQSADIGITALGAQELVLAGSNGTLTISNISFIVSEFELERVEEACEQKRIRERDGAAAAAAADDDDDEEDRDGDCEEFEIGPFFVELPLNGAVNVVSQEVDAGIYSELEFEVEDLHRGHRGDDDEDDDDGREGRSVPDLIQEIRAAGFAQWPEAASMVVVGTFTPRNGPARPFTVYFDADIEIKFEFDPPLVVEGTERTIEIEIDPSFWFRTFANTVTDLSAFDFERTGRVVDFEAKLKEGFQRIEFDD
jgi:hypothetical protein